MDTKTPEWVLQFRDRYQSMDRLEKFYLWFMALVFVGSIAGLIWSFILVLGGQLVALIGVGIWIWNLYSSQKRIRNSLRGRYDW